MTRRTGIRIAALVALGALAAVGVAILTAPPSRDVMADRLRAIDRAQRKFREDDPDGNRIVDYANSLAVLGRHGLLDPELAAGHKEGYRFTLLQGNRFTWIVLAEADAGRGWPAFLIDESGVVRVTTERDPAMGGAVEKKVAADLGALHEAQERFKKDDPDDNGRLDYAASIDALEKAGLVSNDIARGPGREYSVRIVRADAGLAWCAIAEPGLSIAADGVGMLWVDETGKVREFGVGK